eukprot:5139201-Heterocapsa_arctica.AAC.1
MLKEMNNSLGKEQLEDARRTRWMVRDLSDAILTASGRVRAPSPEPDDTVQAQEEERLRKKEEAR